MTPQERQMVDELFDRLAKLETSPRDPDADAAIVAGLRRAPNAVYALVQTVLVQDEALRRANDRIAELGDHAPAQGTSGGGFLDSMRGAFGLEPTQPRGSVPSIRPGDSGSRGGPVWNSGQALGSAPPQNGAYADPRANGGYSDPRAGGGGSSFLGTAAAAAAGMIGGSLLMNSIRGLGGGSGGGFGGGSSGGNQQSLSDSSASGDKASPWSGDQSGSNMARDAGINDIGKDASDTGQRQNSFDQAQADADQDADQDRDDGDDFAGGDFGSDDSGFA